MRLRISFTTETTDVPGIKTEWLNSSWIVSRIFRRCVDKTHVDFCHEASSRVLIKRIRIRCCRGVCLFHFIRLLVRQTNYLIFLVEGDKQVAGRWVQDDWCIADNQITPHGPSGSPWKGSLRIDAIRYRVCSTLVTSIFYSRSNCAAACASNGRRPSSHSQFVEVSASVLPSWVPIAPFSSPSTSFLWNIARIFLFIYSFLFIFSRPEVGKH